MKPWAWIVIAIALTAGAAGLAIWRGSPPQAAAAASDIGGPFTLVDQNGAAVDESILVGKWSAVFFGYTYCPDVCPTTLTSLAQAQAALGARAAGFQVVFITVDPDRDTPRAIKAYLDSGSFPRGARGLTGTAKQIEAVSHAYHVYSQKVPQGASYTMDHSAVVYLMDPKGRFLRPLDVSGQPADVARQITAAMDGH